jgi:DNA-binding transcriptional ArsR family regulator
MAIRGAAALDNVFHALADPTRRGMLSILTRGEKTAGELGEPFRISQPAASKHIRTLVRAGLLSRRVEGRSHHFRLVAGPLAEAETWIARHRKFWEASLDSLGRVLGEMKKGAHS